tara:strand:- start:5 stop:796 length:792 start_codon:yes stop_codon:yes gene_type:complete
MNDVFKHYGIEHLSPSSINTYIKSPARWILRYLYKKKTPGSPAMWRGSVVDSAVGYYFGLIKNQKKGRSLTKVQTDALDQYDYKRREDKALGFEADQEKFDKEKELIPDFIATAVDHYKDCGDPVSYQEKVLYEVKDIPVPIVGYLDLKYKDVVRDLKTAQRKPNDNTYAIRRQVSLYAHVTGCRPIVDYIVCTKHKSDVYSYEVDNVKGNLRVLEQGAYAIQKLLSTSDNIEDIAKLVLPDFDDWMLSEAERDIAMSLWRIK